ncbi:TylF/MycF/NovP-related O-methyltransferase [Clostridium sp. DJ247]|uniref:TylF/MycF/NovP-related O-methyltransferase n=1 Tax=Clostridium sp. DJ247 TaxID=2726188 RepID=UPI0016232582|nr:TylF/MycF/NovP-related O-methyltransferase [Clostridium sp. DJ247]MBC2581086.1 methyltransferase [Clostridium sp. DJ247]
MEDKKNIFGLLGFIIKRLGKIDDTKAVWSFLKSSTISLSFKEKMDIIKKIYRISYKVDCPHTNEEILSYIKTIILLPEEVKGCVIEAGCYKGGSTSKFSLAAKIAGKEFVVFDSFQGIPEHFEPHTTNIYGKPVTFSKGEYCGTLDEVKANIAKYGHPEVCKFVKGWFQDTLPHFKEPIAAMYIDVDLAASVKSCLKYLYPLLAEGGVLYCQDGHLPLVIEVFDDDSFWINEVGYPKPYIEGLGHKKLIKIVKNTSAQTAI